MKKLVSTLKLSHEEWLKYRKMGIGGSDAGAICGLNPYSSAIQVFRDKTSEDLDNFDNEAMRQGRDLEQYVAQRFMEKSGLKVRKANAIYCHDEYPFIMANVDRMVIGENAGLECKTVNAFNADKWKDGQVPPHYLIQCHHYMLVTGAESWYIAAVILGIRFVYQKIERDEDIINNLIKIESNFWNECVMKGVMPEPDGSKVCDEILSKYYPKAYRTETLQLQGYREKLQRRSEIVDVIERMEQEKSKIEQEIKSEMGEFEQAVCDNYRISWTTEISKTEYWRARRKTYGKNVIRYIFTVISMNILRITPRFPLL